MQFMRSSKTFCVSDRWILDAYKLILVFICQNKYIEVCLFLNQDLVTFEAQNISLLVRHN